MRGETVLFSTILQVSPSSIGVSAVTLAAHVLAGLVALLAGLGAMATRKGSPRHNRAGKLYVLSMAIVVVTSIPLAVIIDSWFLVAIAVFSGYLVAAGYRVIARRRRGATAPTRTDYALHGTMILAGMTMVGGGGYGAVTNRMALGEVLVVFGAIGGALAFRELQQARRPPGEGLPWFARHITFMGGGYIATVTAAVTVNLTSLPALLRWLGPTALGVPLIFYAISRYRPRFGRSRD